MEIQTRLNFLIRYHNNLCKQIESRESFNDRGLNNTITKARRVEKEIERLLDLDDKN